MSDEAQPTDPSPNSPLAALTIKEKPAVFEVVVIGLHAPRQTGKTSMAVAVLSNAVTRGFFLALLPFAAPLRRRVESLVADPQRAFVEKEKPIPQLGGLSVRKAMESEGDYVRQTYGRHHLVVLWSDRVRVIIDEARAGWERKNDGFEKIGMPKLWPGVLVVVADDVRTTEEVEAIREMSGYVFELRRRGVDYGDTHPTDSRLPNECIDVVWELPTADQGDLEAEDELLDREGGRMLDTVLKLRGIKA